MLDVVSGYEHLDDGFAHESTAEVSFYDIVETSITVFGSFK
jgi:hypothetical protein